MKSFSVTIKLLFLLRKSRFCFSMPICTFSNSWVLLTQYCQKNKDEATYKTSKYTYLDYFAYLLHNEVLGQLVVHFHTVVYVIWITMFALI